MDRGFLEEGLELIMVETLVVVAIAADVAGDFFGRLSGNNDDEMDFREMAEVPGFGPNDDNDGIGRFLLPRSIHHLQLPPSR
jgi:hypothetical protein